MAAGAYSEFPEKKRTFGKPPAARKGVKPSYEDKEQVAAWPTLTPAPGAGYKKAGGNFVKAFVKEQGLT